MQESVKIYKKLGYVALVLFFLDLPGTEDGELSMLGFGALAIFYIAFVMFVDDIMPNLQAQKIKFLKFDYFLYKTFLLFLLFFLFSSLSLFLLPFLYYIFSQLWF